MGFEGLPLFKREEGGGGDREIGEKNTFFTKPLGQVQTNVAQTIPK